jgi:moderate conductance mechanosensitive channel
VFVAEVPPTVPSPAPSTSILQTPVCDTDKACQWILERTDIQWLATSSYWLILKPLRILAIILVALLIRWLLHRAIKRLTRTTSRAAMPALLKPLREKSAPAVEDGQGQFIPERRRQRAEAIGSVLRSFVTAAIFTMAALLVFAELGFNLGPLLASAGIVGVALGFGAQSLVKDLIAGLRITTVRDMRGVLWYIRNGEIVRVGNKSQGWALVVIDIPIGFVGSEEAVAVLRTAAEAVAASPEHRTEFLEPPEVIGVEQLTVDGAVIRTIAKSTAEGQPILQRELRRALTDALDASGLSERIAASRMLPRSAVPPQSYAPPADRREDTGGTG